MEGIINRYQSIDYEYWPLTSPESVSKRTIMYGPQIDMTSGKVLSLTHQAFQRLRPQVLYCRWKPEREVKGG